jgi:ParB/RepB/Spo0J family partition protein
MQLATIALETVDSNPHPLRTLSDLKALTASIKARGVLVPILAVTDGERFITVAGHHRVAAAREAGLTEIPALIFETYSAADQVAAQLAENDQRRDLTTMERARGYQALLDLGMKEQDVVQATGATKQDLANAVAIVKASAPTIKAIESVQPSLEEAAAIVEFAGTRYANRIEGSITSGQFKHELEFCRQEKQRDDKRETAKAELKAAGIPLITEEHYCYDARRGIPVTRLDAKAQKAHASCPGHAALVDYSGKPEFFCTKPTLHGKVGGSEKTEGQKALDKAKRESRAAWKAATVVRMNEAKAIMNASAAGSASRDAAIAFLAAFAIGNGLPAARAFGIQSFTDAFRPISADKPIPALLALAFGQCEHAIAGWIKYRGGVIGRFDTASYPRPDSFPGYLEFLVACGYTPADREKAYIDLAAKETGKDIEVDYVCELTEDGAELTIRGGSQASAEVDAALLGTIAVTTTTPDGTMKLHTITAVAAD